MLKTTSTKNPLQEEEEEQEEQESINGQTIVIVVIFPLLDKGGSVDYLICPKSV